MVNEREMLQIRAEYILWSGRKAVHQSRLKLLQSKYILEQDDVDRLERGLFSKWKCDYDEKLEKEKLEAEKAKLEWKKVSAIVKTAEEKLPMLEEQMKKYADFWKTEGYVAFSGEDQRLYCWCQKAEMCLELERKTNLCIGNLKAAEKYAFAGAEVYEKTMLELQGQIDQLWAESESFLENAAEIKKVEKGICRLDFLGEGHWETVSSFGRCGTLEEIGRTLMANSTFFEMEKKLEQLREQFGIVFEELAENGEVLLRRIYTHEK